MCCWIPDQIEKGAFHVRHHHQGSKIIRHHTNWFTFRLAESMACARGLVGTDALDP